MLNIFVIANFACFWKIVVEVLIKVLHVIHSDSFGDIVLIYVCQSTFIGKQVWHHKQHNIRPGQSFVKQWYLDQGLLFINQPSLVIID